MQKFNGNYHKMQMTDERFIVKKDEGIVICQQKYRIRHSVHYGKKCKIRYVVDDNVFTSTGIARCSKDDRFDEKTGRMIAQTKANLKAYRKYENWSSNVFREVMKIVEKYQNTVIVSRSFTMHEDEKLAELVRESEK